MWMVRRLTQWATGPQAWLPMAFCALIVLALGEWGVLPGAIAQDADLTEHATAHYSAGQPADPTVETRDDTSAAKPATISGPRDLLQLYGIDQSHFDRLTDGMPWQEAENEILLRIMFRLRDFRLLEIERWARGDLAPSELAKDPGPGPHRGEIFRIVGRVTSVEVCRPLLELGQRFELSEYYRCEFLLDQRQQPAAVFARTIPSAWKIGQPINQRAGALGLFLKLGRQDRDLPEPIFVAPRVAWYPPTTLGKLGMDMGLFDDLRPQEAADSGSAAGETGAGFSLRDLRLTSRNRECFYQLLAAVGRAKPGQLLKEAQQELTRSGEERFSVVPLFNEPARQQGRLVALSGTAREVLPVRVGDEDIVARFGINHYYQVLLFTEDSQRNPLVFCVRELPQGMPTGEGPQYGEYVTVAGFFFNTWAYRNRRPAGVSQTGPQWQLAPLLIGRELVWLPRQEPAADPLIGGIAGGLFLLLLLGVWLALWRYSRGDKRFRAQTPARQFAIDSGISLDQVGLDAEGGPDFSGIEQAARPHPESSSRPAGAGKDEPVQ